MLPAPHGPADAPLTDGDPAAVADGRTPGEGELRRVVEHLEDVPDEDGDAARPVTDEEAATPGDAPDGPPGPAADATAVGPVAAALSDTRHTIDALNPAELLFLAQQRALVAGLCDDPTDAGTVGALFDRVRRQWALAEDRPDPRSLADAFGVALGDLVRAQAPTLDWAVCSDRYGTEIVLAQRVPEVLVYPIAAVAQYWESAAEGWFVRHLADVVHGVAPREDAPDHERTAP
ncbi:MAG: DUF3806 domain-containing protein [Cellulomonas iranensis]|uniref:DUF3806 domain-containing protein n=1 Tax=Cellulomonas iranensis TaxID=76862 RepID=UPI00117754EC|nr:DUF3806 domain-containing protein [Cellulomonas iranensis]MBO9569406.1 DUF3806 domain-containing protein [Cellulomonas iranensis]UCN14258.1 DUF3806 domain-containing protein [Cellulomonas iranensis]